MEPICRTITEADFEKVILRKKQNGKYMPSKQVLIDAPYNSYKSFECATELEAKQFRANVHKWAYKAKLALSLKLSGKLVLVYKRPI